MLQKNSESKLPFHYEFPGGKVETSFPSEEDLLNSLISELKEETGIYVESSKVSKLDFTKEYTFEIENKSFNREVHYYSITLDSPPTITINTTKRADGTDEDSHMGFTFVTEEEFAEMKKLGKVSPNSNIGIDLISSLSK